MLEGITQRLMEVGVARLAAAAGGLLAVIAIISFLVSSVSKPDFALLYAELDPKDASKIVTKLESMAVPYELRDNGSQILVPRHEVPRLRLVVAEEGLPVGASIGYEIFDKADAFGTTTFIQDINLVRALEGELSRTIGTINHVHAAKVHLVIPKRQLFSRETQQPSASILLKMKGGIRLAASQVQAVQHLVAAAVPGLSPQQISIVDDRGTLLARGEDMAEGAVGRLTLDEARMAYETRMARLIQGLLERSVGAGKVRAEVTVEMDYDRQTENAEIYDPEGQVARSTQLVEEGQNSNEERQDRSVSVQSNTPDEAEGSKNGHQHQANKTEETVNYEITKTTRTLVKEGGQIKRLSVAVLVDGNYKDDEKGTPVYSPRSSEEMENLTKLVKSAVGFKADRGDTVEVINMAFAMPPQIEGAVGLSWMGFDKSDLLRLLQLLALTTLGVFMIVFIVRPYLARMNEGMPEEAKRFQTLPQPLLEDAASVASQESRDVHVKTEDGGVVTIADNTPTVERIQKVIDANPRAAVEVLRGWMQKELS